jgi:DNA repair protein SbcD/Mre11
MPKILHTADWHLGHAMNGWGRDAEHAIWLERLADVVEAEAVDALVVAGDVFDTVNPSGESQRLFFEALRRFRERRPALITVITGGNHDPAARLEAPSAILEGLGVHVVASVRRRGDRIDAARHMVPLTDGAGEPWGHVLAIPFLRAADLPGLSFTAAEGAGSPVVSATRDFHAEICEGAEALAGGLPVIGTGHLHCAGCLESEGAERRILIGGEHAVPFDVFPESLPYVALGHLHGAQSLDGGRVRYSGSCFPLSASEAGYTHGVTLIEMDGLRRVDVRHLPIERPAAFHRFPARGALEFEALIDALERLDLDPDLPRDLQPFVHATLQATGPAAVLHAEALRHLGALPIRLAGLRIVRAIEAAEPAAPLRTLEDTHPEDLFRAAFLGANGVEPGDHHLAAFREAATGA